MEPKHRIKSELERLQRLIYPHMCNVCGLFDPSDVGICKHCSPILSRCTFVCHICGLPVAGNLNNLICGQCQRKRPHYNRLIAPFWYEAPLSQLITQFKYHQQWQNAEILVRLFCMSTLELNKETIILPIPSHPARVRERGCNSVFELLRILVKKLRVPCDYDYLKRIKNTALQADKTESERKRNIKNAFMTNGYAKYRNVILFDDVVTTGATVNEASQCLRKNGVAEIEVWTIARTKRVTNNYK